MKSFVVAVVLCGLLALLAAANNPDWNGSWTEESNGRLGGLLYTCVRGNQLFGVFSRAGWLEGTVEGVRSVGHWYMAGDPFDDPDRIFGQYDISVLDDNSGFRGEWYFGDFLHKGLHWAEVREPAPAPLYPDDNLCLVPDVTGSVVGVWFGGVPQTDLYICSEANTRGSATRGYGSFTNPDFSGSIEGFIPNTNAFQGYYYTEDRAGGLFLRAVPGPFLRGYRWPAEPSRALLPQASEQIFQRQPQRASIFQCNVNHVFTPSSAAALSAGVLFAVAAVLALMF
jgi:hypothetical protein